MFTITDRLDPGRVATVDVAGVAPTIGAWIAADAHAFAVDPSPNIVALCRALRRGDWPRVHAIADHLNFDVEATPAPIPADHWDMAIANEPAPW